jgi:adenylosuccinate synthase
MLNRPTQIALTFADYFGAENQGVTEWRGLNHEARDFVKRMERFLGVPVTLISTGPETEATIDRTMRRFW